MTSATILVAIVLTASPQQTLSGTVERVIDGDTIEVRIGERLETVRYIGIDTPETVHPTQAVEAMGKEASEFNSTLVEGKQVRLVLDVEERDQYGRLLAYVYVGEVFVNAELVKQGYAMVSTYPPNVRHAETFLEMQVEARTERRGLWATETTQVQQETASGNTTVYATRTGTKYHRDGCSYLSQSKIPVTLAAAVARGLTPCSVCKPPLLAQEERTAPPPPTQSDPTVYITRTGSKYHRSGCRYLSQSRIPIKLSEAKARGYTPCSVCKPPGTVADVFLILIRLRKAG